MSVNPSDSGLWLRPLGDVFLGLNPSGVIRRASGALDMAPTLPVAQIQGLSWQEFVAHYADDSARRGLIYAWQAMAEQRVAPAHWPPYFPFMPGIIVRLRSLEGDPIMSFVAHLSTATDYNLLDDIIETHALDTLSRVVRVTQQLFRGVTGPLTDLQVKDVGHILNNADCARQLLADLRAEVLLPATVAPLPHPLADLFAFSEQDFSNRRVITHRLAIRRELPSDAVYCHAALREIVRRILDTLLSGIETQSAILISASADEAGGTVQVRFDYRSHEPALRLNQRVEPMTLTDPARFENASIIRRLVTAAQACLKPVKGRAWAEPSQTPDTTGRIALILPCWNASPSEITPGGN